MKCFDKLDSMGTVERGKVADLVLLDADPLQDIRNTQRIAAVVVGGKIFQRAALQKMLAQVEVARLHYAAGEGNIEQPIAHAGEEFVYCLQGEVSYKVGEQVYALEVGCSLLFHAALPHGFRSKGEEPAILLMVFNTAEGGSLARRLHISNEQLADEL